MEKNNVIRTKGVVVETPDGCHHPLSKLVEDQSHRLRPNALAAQIA